MSLTKQLIAETILKAIGIANIVPGEAESAAEEVSILVEAELVEAKAQVAAANKLIARWEKQAKDHTDAGSFYKADPFYKCASDLRIALESEGKAAHEQA